MGDFLHFKKNVICSLRTSNPKSKVKSSYIFANKICPFFIKISFILCSNRESKRQDKEGNQGENSRRNKVRI